MPRIVTSPEELRSAAAADDNIVVVGAVGPVPSLSLRPGQGVYGAGPDAALVFTDDADGVRLSRDNTVTGLRLEVSDPTRRAVFNDQANDSFGTVRLRDLTVTGRVEILAAGAVRTGHLVVAGLHIEAGDARACTPRPHSYGVDALWGAFTLANLQPAPESELTADLTGLSAGSRERPVRGSGVLIAGMPGEGDGHVAVSRLHTGEIHSDGGIAPGTADTISGGVFVSRGAFVEDVVNTGPVTTYGPNDMVLDNWGHVVDWTATAPVTSHGPSGIGFVNFGKLVSLTVTQPIETFGTGARGFNVYDGSVVTAHFERIETHGDAAVGIQLDRSVGSLTVHRGVETHGGTGESLVKGVITKLSAVPLSVLSNAEVGSVSIHHGLTAHGDGVPPMELRGAVDSLTVTKTRAA